MMTWSTTGTSGKRRPFPSDKSAMRHGDIGSVTIKRAIKTPLLMVTSPYLSGICQPKFDFMGMYFIFFMLCGF